jgi:tetratricopeptide (TPR) repeat protein
MRLLECTGDLKSLDGDHPDIAMIHSYFLRAESECQDMDGRIRSKVALTYGNFLESTNRFNEAESYYLRALEADPNNDQAALDYGTMLQSRGEFTFAEKLLLLSQSKNNK